MAGSSQNSFLKNQRAKEKKKQRDGKLERKRDKKNQSSDTSIHDMSNLTRPTELGFLPEEKYVGPNVQKKEPIRTAADREREREKKAGK